MIDEAARILGFQPTFRVGRPIDTFATPEITVQLIPTLRETLSNTARHAHATRLEIGLDHTDGTLTLRVSDNDIGLTGHSPEATGCATSHNEPNNSGAP